MESFIKTDSDNSEPLIPPPSEDSVPDGLDPIIMNALQKNVAADTKRSSSKLPSGIIDLTEESEDSSDKTNNNSKPPSLFENQSQSIPSAPLKAEKRSKPVFSEKFGTIVKKLENPNIYKKVVEKANFQGIRDEINKVDWDTTLNRFGIEEAHLRFLSVYNNLWKE